MKTLSIQNLINDNIEYTIVDGQYFFSVKDLESKFDNIKIDKKNIQEFVFKAVKIEDITLLTEFDINIMKTLNFNPKEHKK